MPVKLPNPPNGWAAADDLSAFIDNARLNCFATFTNHRPEYAKLKEIDEIFRKLQDSLLNPRDYFAAFFLFQAHSAFLNGSHLAMSGAAAETNAVLRLSLENALYGFYLARNPASRETWLRRHESEQTKKRVREEFTIKRLLNTLKACNQKEATCAQLLYERCIDYGAHPNERALTLSLKQEVNQDTINFQLIYLTQDPLVFRVWLRTAAQVGASVLGIFQLIFKERFDITGLTDRLSRARQGL